MEQQGPVLRVISPSAPSLSSTMPLLCRRARLAAGHEQVFIGGNRRGRPAQLNSLNTRRKLPHPAPDVAGMR